MAATSPPRPYTPAQPIFNAPQLSPIRMAAPVASQGSYKSGHRGLDVFSPVDQNGSFCFDRVIKSGKVHRRVKNKGAWKPSWKPAYLVLRPNLLSIYQNPDETDLKASITLSDVTAVARVKKVHTDNVFGVFCPSKNYHFQGLSEKDMDNWILHIRSEARTDDDDDLDLAAPQFSSKAADLSNTYESTDISADEMQRPPVSPQRGTAAPQTRAGTASMVPRQRRHSNMQEYSGNEQYTTSHSDFSDLSNSLPKQSSTSLARPPILTPIASSGQLNSTPEAKGATHMALPTANLAESSTDPERVIRQGHLQILKLHKTGVKGWKWFWVVLRSPSLSFYKSEAEYAPWKILAMHAIVNAAEVDPISKSKEYCFQIITDDKTYRFCARDEEDLDKWLGAMKSVLRKRADAQREKGKAKAVMESVAALTLSAG